MAWNNRCLIAGSVSSLVRAARALRPGLWLRLDLHAAFAPQPLEVGFAGAAPARLGRPLLDTGLALEWRGPG